MGWLSNKKDEESPSLPDLPGDNSELSNFPNSDIPRPESPPGLEVNELPALPSNERDYGENVIKDTIENKGVPGMQKSIVSQEPIRAEPFFENDYGREKDDFTNPVVERPPTKEPRFEAVKKPREEPIYVRLDKFEATVDAFEEINKKVVEIEKLLNKIKDVKTQEEKELNEWEQEIRSMKARIDYIDKNVFDKLD